MSMSMFLSMSSQIKEMYLNDFTSILLLDIAGVSVTKWAIEDEEPAGHAFQLNHPESFMFINNCNVILR